MEQIPSTWKYVCFREVIQDIQGNPTKSYNQNGYTTIGEAWTALRKELTTDIQLHRPEFISASKNWYILIHESRNLQITAKILPVEDEKPSISEMIVRGQNECSGIKTMLSFKQL